ncbi:MAG TPA: FG-GAP-like repeat-containing protein [Pyrinomonadaceae bacterium]
MKFFRPLLLFAIVASLLCAIALSGRTQAPAAAQKADEAREATYRANNLGVALLEQYKYKEGADAFTRALQLDPKLQLARINLSIALFNVPDLAGAQREAEKAAAASPAAPQPHYILGLIAKSQNRTEDAIASFQRVLKIDPQDTGSNVNIGQLYAAARKYTEAIAAFRTAIAVEPYNMTALYNLGLALTRSGDRAEGQQMIQRFQQLRQSGAGTTIGQNYLEQGRYSEAIASTGAEAGLVDHTTPPVRFVDATAEMLPGAAKGGSNEKSGSAGATKPGEATWTRVGDCGWSARSLRSGGTGVTLFDFDGDGDLDLLDLGDAGQKLYRNDAGRFVDVTAGAGALGAALPDKAQGGTAIAGDYDNDGREDLFVLRSKQSSLYHNDGGGKFSDRTTAAGIPAYPHSSTSAAFVDVDHDGDLDLFIVGDLDVSKMIVNSSGPLTPAQTPAKPVEKKEPPGSPNVLLRNNGNGTFTDITAQAKVAGEGGYGFQVIPTDFDNRRDVDLLVVNRSSPPSLYRNLRDGTFLNVTAETGLDLRGTYYAAAAGDVNKDAFTDFYFGAWNSPSMLALSDGKGRFRLQPVPAPSGEPKGALPDRAQFIDYDSDGLLDLVTLSSCAQDTFLHVWRNVGDGWVDVGETALGRGLIKTSEEAVLAVPTLVSADLDGDGDTDLIVRSASDNLIVLRNDGGNRNRSLRVRLAGKVSNRSGVGAKVEMRAGSLQQKLETYAASPAPAPSDVVFGLGPRAAVDAVRIIWPAGVVQAETEIGGKGTQASSALNMNVMELDRKPSSCPYLYTWNGERFLFITDFMGGGEMGYWEAPNHYNHPDPDEYVRIRGDQLKERDGRYELRVTNELEEVLYVDRLQLVAVAHPIGVEVYPNEGMTTRPRPFILYKTKNARPPLAATDEHGHDVLPRLAKVDRQYVDDFTLHRIRGYAAEHTLTLKLDEEKRRDKRMLLLLTGWTDYAFSSDNVAASHAGLAAKLPALQVKDARGHWRTVIEDIGIPVGRPQTVTVDLTGKFLSANREVRIVTTLRIYWDQILVDTSDGDASVQLTRLDPLTANLRWRGYSAEVTPDGREPFSYDYTKVSPDSPWKIFPGRYTREGDVRELLKETDDIFVVSRTGDELSLSFGAASLPPLPVGWTRTFLLYSDGFSKEMDINSASPDQVMPLPFHGMKRYPYGAREAYPMTAARRASLEKYNTRIVASPLTTLVTSDK